MKSTLLNITLLACGLAVPFTASAGVAPPAQRLVIPPAAGDSDNAAYSVALGERYALLASPNSWVKPSPSAAAINNAGEVFVFDAVTGLYVKRLTAPIVLANHAFGESVAVCGNVAYIGATSDKAGGNDSGAVFAIDIPTGKLLWKTSGQAEMELGTSMALDGDHLVVGCGGALAGAPSNSGVVMQLNRLTGAVVQTYSLAQPQASDEFGASVAVSGGLAVCGAPGRKIGANTYQGEVMVIDLVERTPIAQFHALDGAKDDEYGIAVAIAGTRILVGAHQADVGGKSEVGAAYLYDASTTQLLGKIAAPAAVPAGARFGRSVALGHGIAAFGANYDNVNDGSAWLRNLETGEMTEVARHDPASTEEFGTCMALCGNTLLIGDPEYYQSGNLPTGTAYLVRSLRRTWDSSVTSIARTDDSAPGLEGPSFTGFGEAAVSSTNEVIFAASLKGYGVTSANNQGVWDTISGTLDLAVRKGDKHSGQTVTSMSRPFFGQSGGNAYFDLSYGSPTRKANGWDNGGNVFAGVLEGGSHYVYASYKMGFSIEKVARLHDFVTSPTGMGEFTFCYSSLIGTAGVTASNDSHIALKTISVIDEAREGDASPAMGRTHGQILPSLAVSGSRLAYAAFLQGPKLTDNQAVFRKTIAMSDGTIVSRKGDFAPGAGMATFSAFLGEGMNSAGKVVLRAAIAGGLAGQTEGLWSDRTGTLAAVALRGQPATGLPAGVKFSRFISHFIISTGDIVFQAQVSGPGITAANDIGLWLSSPGGSELLMREGGAAPDCGSARIGTLQRVDVDASGNYVILASLTGASSMNQALFTGNCQLAYAAQRQPALSLRKGTLIDRAGSEQVKSLSMGANNVDATGCGTKGSARLTNGGGSVFTVEFNDGSKELVFGRP